LLESQVFLNEKIVLLLCSLFLCNVNAQSWRDCIPNSIGPGGGQSIAPGGGQSIAPGGGKTLDRDRTKGLNTDTIRPYNNEENDY